MDSSTIMDIFFKIVCYIIGTMFVIGIIGYLSSILMSIYELFCDFIDLILLISSLQPDYQFTALELQ